MAASSTGKYHPQYALGEGGLVRHTKAALKFLNYILSLEFNSNEFNDREKDCMRAAILCHDTQKQGDGKTSFTVFDHPMLASNTIRSYVGELNESEIELIASCIGCHMGQWNTDKRSAVVLPKPETKCEEMIHMCDYLASRKDIEVLFSNTESAPNVEMSKEDYILEFGKYKGSNLVDILQTDKSYLKWLKLNADLREPLKTFLKGI